MKTEQQGYFEFPTGKDTTQWLHFGMNCLVELENHTKVKLGEWAQKWAIAYATDKDEVEQATYMSDVILSGAKAHDLKHNVDIDYNIYDVREWLLFCMTHKPEALEKMSNVFADSLGAGLGKQTGTASPKKRTIWQKMLGLGK